MVITVSENVYCMEQPPWWCSTRFNTNPEMKWLNLTKQSINQIIFSYMHPFSNWGDKIIIQHLWTILLPFLGKWFSFPLVWISLIKMEGYHIPAGHANIIGKWLNLCKCSVYLFIFWLYYFALAQCWNKQHPPCPFHQHCLSPVSSKQMALCQFGVGLFGALFTHCICLLSLCSRGLGEVGVHMHSCMSYMGTQCSRCVWENNDWCRWRSCLLSPAAH